MVYFSYYCYLLGLGSDLNLLTDKDPLQRASVNFFLLVGHIKSVSWKFFFYYSGEWKVFLWLFFAKHIILLCTSGLFRESSFLTLEAEGYGFLRRVFRIIFLCVFCFNLILTKLSQYVKSSNPIACTILYIWVRSDIVIVWP